MNNLTIINHEGINVVDSREVAEMVGKEHSKLLRDIKTYMEYLGEAKIGFSEFFLESSYVDKNNREQPCYLLTKQGCELVANKMTGAKGVQFTASYVQAFNKMEKGIANLVSINEIKAMVETQFNELAQNKIDEIEEKCSQYYRPSASEKSSISQYIKNRLGIIKANEEYELVKQRVLIKLGATKWEDIPIETLRNSLNVIDESIRIIKLDRPVQTSIFD